MFLFHDGILYAYRAYCYLIAVVAIHHRRRRRGLMIIPIFRICVYMEESKVWMGKPKSEMENGKN